MLSGAASKRITKAKSKQVKKLNALVLDEDAKPLVEIRQRYKEDIVKNWAAHRRIRLHKDQIAVMQEYFERDYVWST